MTKTIQVGDTITATAFNGHVFEYNVIGFYSDGKPRTTSYDAAHSDKCRCDEWEDGDRSIPDW